MFLPGEKDAHLSHNFVRTINGAVRAVAVPHIPDRILPRCIFLTDSVIHSVVFHLIPLFLLGESPASTGFSPQTHTDENLLDPNVCCLANLYRTHSCLLKQ